MCADFCLNQFSLCVIICLAGKRSRLSSATGLSEIKLTKGDKKLAFAAYSEAEKSKYRVQVSPLSCSDPVDDPGSRPVTALDDFMQAMNYAQLVVKASYGIVKMCSGRVGQDHFFSVPAFYLHMSRYSHQSSWQCHSKDFW